MVTYTHRLRPRHAVRTDCLVFGADGRRIGERTIDASWDGIAVRAALPAYAGERVRVSIRVPRSDFWLSAEGRVARVMEGRREGDPGAALGIRLERMHGMDRLVWGTALRRQPPAETRRGEERDYARAVWRIANEG